MGGVLLVLALLTGCTGGGTRTVPSGSATPSNPTGTATTPASPSNGSTSPSNGSASPTAGTPSSSAATVVASRTTHDWAVPLRTAPFATTHTVTVPVAPPPAPPLPCLSELAAARHPATGTAYDQLSFRFTGAFPSYEIAYVPSLRQEGSGQQVTPPGAKSILRVLFRKAQAHRPDGTSCIRSAPPRTLGYPALTGYAPAGDFEGVVVYGLGVGSALNGTAGAKVRVVEVERIEGGRHVFVVAVQVQAPASG